MYPPHLTHLLQWEPLALIPFIPIRLQMVASMWHANALHLNTAPQLPPYARLMSPHLSLPSSVPVAGPLLVMRFGADVGH